MITSSLKIIPPHDKRQEVLDVLLTVKGPVLAEPGCLACCIYQEHDEEQGLLYVEQWRSPAELERHIRSSTYARILEVMELSTRLPELTFFESDGSGGLELIERLRGTDGADGRG